MAVEHGDVRIVTIDGPNGYLNAIPQVEAPLVEVPLVRMHEPLSLLTSGELPR